MKNKIYKFLKDGFVFSWRDCLLSAFIFAFAIAACMLLQNFEKNEVSISMIFILAIVLISRFTNGYFYGIFFSLVSVLAVNFIFTYPYFEFNFSVSGYPLTTICMLGAAGTTSALTTQIKRHGDARIEAEKEKTRSNLLRAISHDLRTPLTSILGATSAIIDNDDLIPKEERLKLLSEIKDDSQWLIRMVENLLSITRIDDIEAKVIKTPEAAEEVVADAVQKFQKRFPENTVNVIVPNEVLIIPMDAVLIEQVIINLLENSAIHSKTATKLELEVTENDNCGTFEVSDDGCGIDEKVLPHIFDGYFKTDYEDNGDKKRNMGIGLSVCYTIIKAHNGKMTAFNKEDGGAAFRFTLPKESS
ncbi:MAG: DUF4118 domain-containing protein [Oscillospiraceae bacterium]